MNTTRWFDSGISEITDQCIVDMEQVCFEDDTGSEKMGIGTSSRRRWASLEWKGALGLAWGGQRYWRGAIPRGKGKR